MIKKLSKLTVIVLFLLIAHFSFAQSITNCNQITNPSAGSGEVRDAVMFLCQRDAITKVADKKPNDFMIRIDLAAMIYQERWKHTLAKQTWASQLPNPFADMSDVGNVNAALALSLLDGDNGISPFTREFGVFRPNNFIKRKDALKVFLESYHVQLPTISQAKALIMDAGVTWFDDYALFENDKMLPYIYMGWKLGLVRNDNFRPNDNLTRGEAFLIYYRLLNNPLVHQPATFEEADEKSQFYVPTLFDIKRASVLRGMNEGNFQHMTTNGLSIGGVPAMGFYAFYTSFTVSQNPAPIQPLGKGWNHPYNVSMELLIDDNMASNRVIIYNYDGTTFPFAYNDIGGVYTSLSKVNQLEVVKISDSQYKLKNQNGSYTLFSKLNADDKVLVATQITDRFGNKVLLEYAGNNYKRLSKVHDGRGRGLTFTYSTYEGQEDLIQKVTDHTGRLVSFTFEETYKQLTHFKDAKGGNNAYRYHNAFITTGTPTNEDFYLLAEVKKPEGTIINTTYNARRLMNSMKINSGYNIKVDASEPQPNSDDYLVTKVSTGVSSSTGETKTNETEYTFTKDGQVTKVQTKAQFFAAGVDFGVERSFLDANNPLLPTSEKAGNVEVKKTYNSYGQPIKIERIAGGRTITEYYEYNIQGDLVKYTNPLGKVTRFVRNGTNNQFLIEIIPPIAETAVYMEYFNNGNLASVVNAEKITQIMDYDQFGVLKTTTNQLGYSTRIESDALGRAIRVTDANGNWQKVIYDNHDNVIEQIRFDGVQELSLKRNFDRNDNLVSIINPLGKQTTLGYDEFERLTSESFAGATKSYKYHEDGRLKEIVLPNGESLLQEYDRYLRLIGNGYATFDYYNTAETAYDVRNIIKNGKAINLQYDVWKRVTKITYNGKSIEYAYNDANQVTGIKYPNGKWVNYAYDDNGRLAGVKDWNSKITTFAYRKDGTIRLISLPNGIRRIYDYDEAGRLISLKDVRSNGEPICAYAINEMDKVGNHTKLKITEPLEKMPLPNQFLGFKNNENNNRLEEIFNKDNNQSLFKIDSDLNGRESKIEDVANNKTATLAFDKANQLTSYQSPDFKATYVMDGNAQRRFATRNGVTTEYVLSGMDVITEYENGKETNYIHGVGLLYRIDDSGNYRYYHYDPRGSTVAMTDDTQKVTHAYSYGDWGQVEKAVEEDLNRYRYVGQWGVMYEAEDLVFMRARYYSPVQKRFLSEDPIWAANLFPYADNNPIMNIDPKGTEALMLAGHNNNFSMPMLYDANYDTNVPNGYCQMYSKPLGATSLLGNVEFSKDGYRNLQHRQWFCSDGTNVGYFNAEGSKPFGKAELRTNEDIITYDKSYPKLVPKNVVNSRMQEYINENPDYNVLKTNCQSAANSAYFGDYECSPSFFGTGKCYPKSVMTEYKPRWVCSPWSNGIVIGCKWEYR